MSGIATFLKDRQPGRGTGGERNITLYECEGIHIINCVLVWKTLQTYVTYIVSSKPYWQWNDYSDFISSAYQWTYNNISLHLVKRISYLSYLGFSACKMYLGIQIESFAYSFEQNSQ